MRLPFINKQKVYYALYEGKTALVDDEGNPTGEYSVQYGEPEQICLNVGPAKYTAQQTEFGIHDGATIQLTTANRSVPWDTKTVWWLGVETEAPHNYETLSISRSKSACVIRLREVAVSGS